MDTIDPFDPLKRTERIDRIRELLPGNERAVDDLADFFKILGDPTRMKILFALGAADLCVTEIAELLDMNHSAISHQLRLLSRSRLIKSRKSGKNVYYTLIGKQIRDILAQGFDHIRE